MGSCVSKPKPSPLSVGTGVSGELSFRMAPVRPSGGEESARAALSSHENPSNPASRESNTPHTSRPNDDAAQSIRDMLRGRELGQRVRESRSGTCPSPSDFLLRDVRVRQVASPRARRRFARVRANRVLATRDSPLATRHSPRTTYHAPRTTGGEDAGRAGRSGESDEVECVQWCHAGRGRECA